MDIIMVYNILNFNNCQSWLMDTGMGSHGTSKWDANGNHVLPWHLESCGEMLHLKSWVGPPLPPL